MRVSNTGFDRDQAFFDRDPAATELDWTEFKKTRRTPRGVHCALTYPTVDDVQRFRRSLVRADPPDLPVALSHYIRAEVAKQNAGRIAVRDRAQSLCQITPLRTGS